MRAAALCLLAAACAGEPVPAFPADYAAAFTEVRGCRASADHDLHKIRVLADPAARDAYTTRATPFPEGAIVLKEEYDFTDGACAGPVVEWTVMRRLADGWAWQRVAADRTVTSEDDRRCIGCHAQCGQPPDGHDGTCAVP